MVKARHACANKKAFAKGGCFLDADGFLKIGGGHSESNGKVFDVGHETSLFH